MLSTEHGQYNLHNQECCPLNALGFGIQSLERSCGIPLGDWYHPSKTMYRFTLDFSLYEDLKAELGLRMAKGNESRAYPQHFKTGGKTSGGNSEAVIDAMSILTFQSLIERRVINIEKLDLPNTPDFHPDDKAGRFGGYVDGPT